jgi:hypothetical protein
MKSQLCSQHGDQQDKWSVLVRNVALVAMFNFRFLPNSCLSFLLPVPTYVQHIEIIHQHLQHIEHGQTGQWKQQRFNDSLSILTSTPLSVRSIQ